MLLITALVHLANELFTGTEQGTVVWCILLGLNMILALISLQCMMGHGGGGGGGGRHHGLGTSTSKVPPSWGPEMSQQ